MSGPQESSQDLDRADSDALVVRGLERLEDGGQKGLTDFLAGLGERSEAVRARIDALRRTGMLHSPAQDRLRMPEQLGGYSLGARLGVGGMGMVFQATHGATGEACAVKLIRPEYRIYETSRLRFQREIEAASRLSHPGIVRVRDFGEGDGILFYTMELIAGVNLGDLCAHWTGRSADRLTGADLQAGLMELSGVVDLAPSAPPNRLAGSWANACLQIAADAADALAHAHEQGVLHRDVKPSNLLLTPAGRVVLVDFGLALLQGEGSLTESGSRLGSLPYMAPESLQGKGSVAGPFTDIYGLGVTLYELLALSRAYPAETPLALERQIQTARPRPLARMNRAVGRDTETLIQKAMDRDPGRRYLRAEDFARDARRILAGKPILARRPSRAARTLRWMQDNPRPAAVAGGVAGLTLAGSLLFAGMQRQEQRKTSLANKRLIGEQQRVERNLRAAMDSVAAQVNLIRDPKLYRAEFQGLRESLAASITEFLDQLLAVEGQSPEYKQARASAQFFIGTMELELGRTLSAHRRFRDCLGIRREQLKSALESGDPAAILLGHGDVAWTSQRLGLTSAYLGQQGTAREACDGLAAALVELDRGRPMTGGAKRMHGHLAWTRGLLALDAGMWEEARLELTATRRWEERWLMELPRPAHTLVGMANTDLYLVELERRVGEPDRALAKAEEGLGRILEASTLEPELSAAWIEGARLSTLQAELLTGLGRTQDALAALDRAERWADQWRGHTGDVPRILPELARCHVARAEALAASDRAAESREVAEEAIASVGSMLASGLRHGREQGELLAIFCRAAALLDGTERTALLAQARTQMDEALAFAPDCGLLRELASGWGRMQASAR